MSTNKHTDGEDQLDSNGPLSSKNGGNPFRVDDSYFDDFNAKLNDALVDLEDIKELAPTLYQLPKYNPFEVPAGYFDEFPTNVQNVVATQAPRFSIGTWLQQLLKPNFAFPVIITILIAIAGIRYTENQNEQLKNNATSEVSLEEELYPIDENLLVDLLAAEMENAESKISSTDETIANYLIDNNVDENSLNVDNNTTDYENE